MKSGAAGSSRHASVLGVLGAALLFGLLVYVALWRLTTREGWISVGDYPRLFWLGWLGTIEMASGALVVSVLLGLLLTAGRRSPWLPIRAICSVHVELIRGTPLLAQILILYYGIFHLAGLEDRTVSGILILSNFAGAYLSEIFRAGIEGIPRSQLESAKAIGLTSLQTYRFVIFPQAIRQILPALAGQFASLIKDSSLLSIIGIEELTQNSQQVASATFSNLESYVPLAVGYLVLTLPISLWSRYLEKTTSFDT